MLSIILSTVFADGHLGHYGEYKNTGWDGKPEYALGRVQAHMGSRRFDKAVQWLGHAQRSAERAAQIKGIDNMLGSLTEKRGQLEQVIREAQDAVTKADGTRAEIATISSQIDELTVKKNQLMSNIVQQAQQADVTAAKVAEDVTRRPSAVPTVEPTAATIPQEGLVSGAETSSREGTEATAVPVMEAAPAPVEQLTPAALPEQTAEQSVVQPAAVVATESVGTAPEEVVRAAEPSSEAAPAAVQVAG